MSLEAYLQLLGEQIEKNLLINELARRGRDAIAAVDIAPVIEGDAIRKELMLQIRSLQSAMDHCLKILPDTFANLESPLKDKIIAANSRLHAIVRETVSIDQQNQTRVREIRTALGEKLEGIGRGKRALSGYRAPAKKKPKLFDGQG